MPELSEIIKRGQELQGQIETAVEQLGIGADEARIVELTTKTQELDFWNNPQAATAVTKELAALERHIEGWRRLLGETKELVELASLEKAGSGDAASIAQLAASLDDLAAEFERRQTELKLSGPYDREGAILSIYAGTGGTDAQDWAEMLLRMYLRYCERAGFTTEILSQSPGEEAGIKSVTLEIGGPLAYGKLKGEQGVHRLVRLSPFNADNLRQTSFALVEIIPNLATPPELEIEPKDLRIDVYRSSGHGGQSVNTTDSAVRITHLPTGIVVAIQNERSQLKNKDKAMAVLASRLALLLEREHKEKLSELRGATQSADWGQQIRSYVLHPYTKVKDHRTGAETAQAQSVLDGDLDLFIEAYLTSQIGQ